MTARTLTIPPFELPHGQNPPVTVIIALVDADNRRIQGLTAPDGQPVIDLVEVTVSDTPVQVDLWPQPELQPVLNLGSGADITQSYYLVTVRHKPTRYLHVVRTQIASGGALDWSEFIAGAGPPQGGTLPEWLAHLTDSAIHVPSGGDPGDVLGKQTGADGDTVWIPPSQAGLPAQVTQPEKDAGTETALRSFSPFDIADMSGTHGGGGGTNDHSALINRDAVDSHPQAAVTNLTTDLAAKAAQTDLDAHTSNAGIHVPGGGAIDQVLKKNSGTSGDTGWGDAGVSDHGNLNGLADDDHLQYHNDARGDARYTPVAHAADAGIHVPAGGAVGTALLKTGAGDGQTGWGDVATQAELDAHTGAAGPHSGHLIEVQAGAGIVVNPADPQRPIVSSLGLNVLSENVPGTGDVWDDVNAHFFSGPDSDGNGRMCIGPSDIAYVGHNNIIYQYFGPQSVCIGAGGAGGIYPHRNTISSDWQATGSTDHRALTQRDAADSHPQSAITDLVSDLAGKEPAIGAKLSAFNRAYAGSGVANTTARSDHNHDGQYDVDGAAAAVQGNLDTHTGAVADAHPQGAITGLVSDLAGKEPTITPKNDAFNRSFAGGGVATTVARSDHLHPGVYDPSGSAAAVQSNLDNHEGAVSDAHPQAAITGLVSDLAGKEPTISPKNSAFNRPFAGTGAASTVARSDHTHDHDEILNRDVDDSHPQSAITGLVAALAGKEPAFGKQSAFNKNFAGGGVADTVARSDHLHDSEYMRNVIDDTDPYVGGDLKVGGPNNWGIIFTDSLGAEQGSIGWAQVYGGVGFGWTPGGTFEPVNGGMVLRSGGFDIYGAEVVIDVLKHADSLGQQVYVSPDGALYAVDPPAPGWETTDTDTGSYDLGTGTGQGAWIEMTGLEASVVQDVAAGDPIHVQAIVCAVNKTTSRTGTISIGFGIGVGNPPTGTGIAMPIGAGQSGLLTPINIRDTSHGGLTAGTIIGIWARRESGSHSQFGVDMDGTVETHEMVLYVPGGGGGGDPTNLNTLYDASGNFFTITSSTGSNAVVANAVAGGDAGALSGTRAQKIDDSIVALVDDTSPVFGGNPELGGASNHRLKITDAAAQEAGSIAHSLALDGVSLGWTPSGTFNSEDGGVLVRRCGTVVYGACLSVDTLKHTDSIGRDVRVSLDGALFDVERETPKWTATDSDDTAYDLGSGITQGPWVELTGLVASLGQDVAATDAFHIEATISGINKSTTERGKIEIGYGIGVGVPPAGDVVEYAVSGGFSGKFHPAAFRVAGHGGLSSGQAISIWARRASGSGSGFGVDLDGPGTPHDLVLYAPKLGISALADDPAPQLGGPLKGTGNTIDDYSNGYVNITGTTHTLQAADSGKVHTFNNASNIALTLPDTLPAGFVATIIQLGAGAVQPSTAGGATLLNRQGHTETAGTGAMATLAVYANAGNAAAYVFGGDTA